MGFTGAGVYEIVPYQAPKLNANSWGGGLNVGQDVRTYERGSSPTDNAKWQLALVAGSGDDAEYLIINVLTGYFITATGEFPSYTLQFISPTDPTARWTIKSSSANGYDVYTITSKVSSRGQLTVKDFSTQSGADILSATKKDQDNQRWYFEPR
ncbi:hypothetical protein BKA67DRAFT_535963 [Truncatella angustata]|uniref:Ricin B lectin domain-containing protein n=1 Tax=Truncatella angustata TaxID=152316 RepID=A0A9P8UM60_9PEZI|nr:uncharacterized protein BKA67DRAFT_535963 [Truncatella angustata]KAH6654653.1 hypothetical protein BKA67DRAFT_535963 [Truncatella angustata]KAH8199660.1 hypothetical protein TruAng_006190 [Truncatella angustata]